MGKVALITGASGLLGRAVLKKFKASKKYDNVVGLAFSRAGEELVKLDLTDSKALSELFEEVKPTVIIHCAAERRPDVAEKDTSKALELNVQVSKNIATLALQHKARLVYISTDYVFDGTSPPYSESAVPNPLNFYGKSKLEGEIAVHKVNPHSLVLRVPILYGEVQKPEESAVNVLVNAVKNSEKKVTMDHHASRFPTNVEDVATVCLEIAESSKELAPSLHYSNPEKLTKYEICKIFAEILKIPNIDHIEPETEAVLTESQPSKPENAQLSMNALHSVGLGKFEPTNFKNWFEKYLTS